MMGGGPNLAPPSARPLPPVSAALPPPARSSAAAQTAEANRRRELSGRGRRSLLFTDGGAAGVPTPASPLVRSLLGT